MHPLALRALFVVAASTPLAAHDFWIEPARFAPEPETVLAVSLRVGDHGRGETVSRDPSRIRRFDAVTPAGTTAIVGRT